MSEWVIIQNPSTGTGIQLDAAISRHTYSCSSEQESRNICVLLFLLLPPSNPVYILSRVPLGLRRHMPPVSWHVIIRALHSSLFIWVRVCVRACPLFSIYHRLSLYIDVLIEAQILIGRVISLFKYTASCVAQCNVTALYRRFYMRFLVWLTSPSNWRPPVCLGWPWLWSWTEWREICPRNQTSELLWWRPQAARSRWTSPPGDREKCVKDTNWGQRDRKQVTANALHFLL